MNKRELLDQIYDTLFYNHLDLQFDPDRVIDQEICENDCILFKFDDGSTWEITVKEVPESWMNN